MKSVELYRVFADSLRRINELADSLSEDDRKVADQYVATIESIVKQATTECLANAADQCMATIESLTKAADRCAVDIKYLAKLVG